MAPLGSSPQGGGGGGSLSVFTLAVLLGTALAAAVFGTVLANRQPEISDNLASNGELEEEGAASEEAPASDEFLNATQRVKQLNVSDAETLLRLYGLFKRVTVGRASAKEKPWEPTARAKWNAWNDCRDLSKQEAASLYVDLVHTLDKASSGSSSTSTTKQSLGPKVSKMMTAPQADEEVVNFAGSDLFDQVRQDFSKLKNLLAVHPELVRVRDEENRTLLHWAVDSDSLEAAVLLLEHGAEIDAKDIEDFTPLGYAASSDLSELALFLVNAGADVDRASPDKSAAQLARDPALRSQLEK